MPCLSTSNDPLRLAHLLCQLPPPLRLLRPLRWLCRPPPLLCLRCLPAEYCSRGSLLDVLRAAASSEAAAASLTWMRRLGMVGAALRLA